MGDLRLADDTGLISTSALQVSGLVMHGRRRQATSPLLVFRSTESGLSDDVARAQRHVRAISCRAFPGVAVHLWLGRDSICRSGALPRQTGWPVASAGMRRNRVDSPISVSTRAIGAPRQ